MSRSGRAPSTCRRRSGTARPACSQVHDAAREARLVPERGGLRGRRDHAGVAAPFRRRHLPQLVVDLVHPQEDLPLFQHRGPDDVARPARSHRGLAQVGHHRRFFRQVVDQQLFDVRRVEQQVQRFLPGGKVARLQFFVGVIGAQLQQRRLENLLAGGDDARGIGISLSWTGI
jgi:hypothetical protein